MTKHTTTQHTYFKSLRDCRNLRHSHFKTLFFWPNRLNSEKVTKLSMVETVLGPLVQVMEEKEPIPEIHFAFSVLKSESVSVNVNESFGDILCPTKLSCIEHKTDLLSSPNYWNRRSLYLIYHCKAHPIHSNYFHFNSTVIFWQKSRF